MVTQHQHSPSVPFQSLLPKNPKRKIEMHYRNGREAKNGDKIVMLNRGDIIALGLLHSAVPGNDYCNGNIAVIQQQNVLACLSDCLHVDDAAAAIRAEGLATRPSVTFA